MAAIRLLLFSVCIAFICRGHVPDGNLLGRTKLVAIARGELEVREKTGHNDGEKVEEYLAAVHLSKGNPWCAGFLCWIYKQGGYAEPRTGWSPALFPASRRIKIPSPGTIFGIYFKSLGRIAHCGMVEKIRHSWIYSIEGNSNLNGGREGDGVHRRIRHMRTIQCFADWTGGP